MTKRTKLRLTLPLTAAFGVASVGCQSDSADDMRDSPVAEETEDLKEALQEPDPDEMESLQQSVDETTQKLARLEERMERTKTGISDEVLKEREELKEAMRKQQARVKEKIQAAARAAQRYNELNDRAVRLLERTAPPEIEAEVAVTIAKFPKKIDLDASAREHSIELETNEIQKTQPKDDESKSPSEESGT